MFKTVTELKPVIQVDVSGGIIGKDLEFAHEFQSFCQTNGNILLLCANQVEDNRNMLAFFDDLRWDVAANMSITNKEGEPVETAIQLTTQAKEMRALVNIFPKITVEYFSLVDNAPVEFEITRRRVGKLSAVKTPSGKTSTEYVYYGGNQNTFLLGMQLAEKLLAAEPLTMVKADYRTIRAEKKVGPNDPCPCSSGKKFKRCCLR